MMIIKTVPSYLNRLQENIQTIRFVPRVLLLDFFPRDGIKNLCMCIIHLTLKIAMQDKKANIKLLQCKKAEKKKSLNLYFSMNGSNYSKEQTKIKSLSCLEPFWTFGGAIKTDMGYQVDKHYKYCAKHVNRKQSHGL